MRISVIDDNSSVRVMVAIALQLHGHIVDAYANSSSFFAAMQSSGRVPAYDLVIVDLFLGNRLGTEIVDAMNATQIVPTILISAAEENIFAPIRRSYPELQILQKPFKIQALVSLVDQAGG
jgi:DNA-binding response OmpR family regulator